MKLAPRRSPELKKLAEKGPFRAEVLTVVDEDNVLVRRAVEEGGWRPAEEVISAEIAVIGYLPKAGDHVLITGSEPSFVTGAFGEARRRGVFALSVTEPEDGSAILTASGDLTIRASGRLSLRSDDLSIETASAIGLRTGRLEVEADRVIERAKDTYRHVEGLAELQAKRARTLVEDTCRIVAGKTTIVSEDDTLIDGKRVLLG